MKLVSWQAKRARFIIDTYSSHDVYMCIDPGSKGGATVWKDGVPVDGCVFDQFKGYHKIRLMVQKWRVRLFILESAYAGKSIKSALKLGFWRGYVVNECVHSAYWPMTTIEVPPSTWQAQLPRDEVPAEQPWDKDAKTLATWTVYKRSPLYGVKTIPEHDAIASSLGIGYWWNKVTKGIP